MVSPAPRLTWTWPKHLRDIRGIVPTEEAKTAVLQFLEQTDPPHGICPSALIVDESRFRALAEDN